MLSSGKVQALSSVIPNLHDLAYLTFTHLLCHLFIAHESHPITLHTPPKILPPGYMEHLLSLYLLSDSYPSPQTQLKCYSFESLGMTIYSFCTHRALGIYLLYSMATCPSALNFPLLKSGGVVYSSEYSYHSH